MNRRKAREQAFLFIFEKSFNNECSKEKIISNANEARGDINLNDFSESIIKGIDENSVQIDSLIDQNLVKWKKSRLSRVAISLLRIAVYEILFEESIPVSVSINEAVELAKTYGGSEDSSFINGVLGSLAKNLQKGV